MRSFKQCFLAGRSFSGGSGCLLFCVLFLGCVSDRPGPTAPLSRAQIEEGRRQLEIQKRAWVARRIIARAAAADATMLDLTPFYDMELPGLPSEKDTPFRFLKPGNHTWDGVKFDVRGMIDPGFRDWDEVQFDYHHGATGPASRWGITTNSIPVGRKCSEIDFLHGVFGIAGASMNRVSQFVIHFTNGQNEAVPIVFGRDVSDSQFNENFIPTTGVVVPTNAVVWEQRSMKTGPPQPFFGFYIKRWNNPFPE